MPRIFFYLDISRLSGIRLPENIVVDYFMSTEDLKALQSKISIGLPDFGSFWTSRKNACSFEFISIFVMCGIMKHFSTDIISE